MKNVEDAKENHWGCACCWYHVKADESNKEAFVDHVNKHVITTAAPSSTTSASSNGKTKVYVKWACYHCFAEKKREIQVIEHIQSEHSMILPSCRKNGGKRPKSDRYEYLKLNEGADEEHWGCPACWYHILAEESNKQQFTEHVNNSHTITAAPTKTKIYVERACYRCFEISKNPHSTIEHIKTTHHMIVPARARGDNKHRPKSVRYVYWKNIDSAD